jgi:hypothetical protein
MLNLTDWLAPVVAVSIAALVPLVIVGWFILALADRRQVVLTLIKAIVSLLVWVPVSYAMIYIYLFVTFHGGSDPSRDGLQRTLKGNIVLFSASLVYIAIGYGLAVWVRGKPRTRISSERTRGDEQTRDRKT